MLDEKDVGGPRKILRVLGAANEESEMEQLLRRFDEQTLKHLLPIFRVSSQIGQVGAKILNCWHRLMHLRVDAAIERQDLPRAEFIAQRIKGAASCVAENQVEVLQAPGPNVADGASRAQL